MMGYPAGDVDSIHFQEAPSEEQLERVRESAAAPFGKRNRAHLDAIRYVATKTDLVAVGMAYRTRFP